MSDHERLAIPSDGALSARMFGICIDDLLARQEGRESPGASGGGFLVVLRNEIPSMILAVKPTVRRELVAKRSRGRAGADTRSAVPRWRPVVRRLRSRSGGLEFQTRRRDDRVVKGTLARFATCGPDLPWSSGVASGRLRRMVDDPGLLTNCLRKHEAQHVVLPLRTSNSGASVR
jgi:hypothetical protein